MGVRLRFGRHSNRRGAVIRGGVADGCHVNKAVFWRIYSNFFFADAVMIHSLFAF